MNTQSHWLRYFLVWLALLAGTGMSFLAAQLDLGVWETVIGLCIASIKVSLVALYFMHLREERGVFAIVAIATVLWIALLCAGIASDVGMR